MTGHTRTEKRLRGAIAARQVLSKGIARRLSKICRWEERLLRSGSERWKKRYAGSIARLSAEVEKMKVRLARENADITARIVAETEFSKQEVEAFQRSFEYERTEAIARRKAYEAALAERRKAEKLLSDATQEKTAEDHLQLQKLIKRVRFLRIQVKREDRDAAEVKQELDAEARDKRLFQDTLERIGAENVHYSLKTNA